MTKRPRLRTASLLLAALGLAACQLPTKIGDLPDTESQSSDEPSPSTGATEADTGSVTGESSGDSTGAPTVCASLDEQACEAEPECLSLHGQPDLLPGCDTEETVFVVCYDKDLDCPEGESTVCIGDELYHVPVTCNPPGTNACTTIPRCGLTPCEDLPELDCTKDPGCEVVKGVQGVETDGMLCFDGDPVYLGCRENTGACPPFAPTVCSPELPDAVFQTGGCIPPGFEQCEEETPQGCP